MHKFITDFIKIGQSGPTIDGRNIDPVMLTDAAETYDPAVYTAVIWVDHMRWYGNYGKVVELKAERGEGGIVSLYARLQPNEFLVAQNGAGQKLFTSMELQPNFAETGKYYLSGLAVTDEPASLGTHELRFSRRKTNDANVILCGVELTPLAPSSYSDEEPPGWFKSFLSRFASRGESISDQPNNEDNTMNEVQFAALKGALDKLEGAVSGIAEKFSPTVTEPDSANADEDKQLEAEALTSLTKQLSDLTANIETQFAMLASRFEGEKSGTHVGDITQPGADEKYL